MSYTCQNNKMHTVTIPNFLENNNEFTYSIYTDLKCVKQCILWILHIKIQYTFCKL